MNKKLDLVRLTKKLGMISLKDIDQMKISRKYAYDLVEAKILKRVSKGIFVLYDEKLPPMVEFILTARRFPRAVINLHSALYFHQMIEKPPVQLYFAIPRRTYKPNCDYANAHISFLTGPSYAYGIEEHLLHSTAIKVYSPAKTVADCFKFRNSMGVEQARAMLKKAIQLNLAGIDDLKDAARICRVEASMLPFLRQLL